MFSFNKKSNKNDKVSSTKSSSLASNNNNINELVIERKKITTSGYQSSISVTERTFQSTRCNNITGTCSTSTVMTTSNSLIKSPAINLSTSGDFRTDNNLLSVRPRAHYRSAFTCEPLTTTTAAARITTTKLDANKFLLSSPSNNVIKNTKSSSPTTAYGYQGRLPSTSSYQNKVSPITRNQLTTHQASQLQPFNNATNLTVNEKKTSATARAGAMPEIMKQRSDKTDDNNVVVPMYRMNCKNRNNCGEILIINNIMFTLNEYRHGAEIDEDKLVKLAKHLRLKSTIKRNLKINKMEEAIKNFAKRLGKVDVSVVVVMSHGTNRGTTGQYTEIYGVDDQGLAIDKILDYFSTINCPDMRDKPKIFIFQCCRGNDENFIETDAIPLNSRGGRKSVKVSGDILVAHSTLPGFSSHRDPTNGTWYIQTICDVFTQYAHEYHVEDLLKIVDDKLSRYDTRVKQTASYENRGFKRCYLVNCPSV